MGCGEGSALVALNRKMPWNSPPLLSLEIHGHQRSPLPTGEKVPDVNSQKSESDFDSRDPDSKTSPCRTQGFRNAPKIDSMKQSHNSQLHPSTEDC